MVALNCTADQIIGSADGVKSRVLSRPQEPAAPGPVARPLSPGRVRLTTVATLTSQTVTRTGEDMRLGDSRDETGDVAHEQSFDDLVRLHQPAVARLAHRLLGWRDRDAVEDIVQEVFLVALRRLEGFRGNSSLGTWLMGITLNQCRAHRRRSMLRMRWLRRLRDAGGKASPEPGDDTTEAVRWAVADLPPRDREVIVLFYLEQMPVAEIGRLLGARNNAIEVRLHRARQRLRERLAGLMGD